MSSINNKTPNVKENMETPPRIIRKYKVLDNKKEFESPVFKLEISNKCIKNNIQIEYWMQIDTPKIKKSNKI